MKLRKTHAVFTGNEFHDWLCVDEDAPLEGVRPFYRTDGPLTEKTLDLFLAAKTSHPIERLTAGQWLVIDCCETRILYEKCEGPDEAIARLAKLMADERDGHRPYQFNDDLKQCLSYVLEQLTEGKKGDDTSLKVAGQWLTQAITFAKAIAPTLDS